MSAGEQLVVSTEVDENRLDYAAGMRHLMVLLAVAIDVAPRVEPDPVLAVDHSNTEDTTAWGLEYPDYVYTSVGPRAEETYRRCPAIDSSRLTTC